MDIDCDYGDGWGPTPHYGDTCELPGSEVYAITRTAGPWGGSVRYGATRYPDGPSWVLPGLCPWDEPLAFVRAHADGSASWWAGEGDHTPDGHEPGMGLAMDAADAELRRLGWVLADDLAPPASVCGGAP